MTLDLQRERMLHCGAKYVPISIYLKQKFLILIYNSHATLLPWTTSNAAQQDLKLLTLLCDFQGYFSWLSCMVVKHGVH